MTTGRGVGAVLLGSAVVLMVGCGSKGSVTGKLIADGAPLAGQTVVLQGNDAPGSTVTGTDGTYAFKDVKTHAYVLSVDVPDTRERHQQVSIDVEGAVTVPDLVFSGLGTVTGTVTDPNGAPISGAQVFLLGTQLSASTDAQGNFTFTDAPDGDHTVSVTTSDGHAEATVTVTRGAAQQVALQIVANPPGTVNGQVSYLIPSDASSITVSVPAAGVSVHPQADGTYSFQVPAGTWDVWATATYFPNRKLGTVTVASNGTATVDPAQLSVYTDLPSFGVVGGVWSIPNGQVLSMAPRVATVLLLQGPSAAPAYYAYNLQTGALRLLSVGSPAWISHDGTKAIVQSAQGLALAEDFTTGTQFPVPLQGSGLQDAVFTPDDSGARLSDGAGPSIQYVVDFTHQTATTVSGFASQTVAFDYLVRTTNAAPLNWSYVTGSGALPVFNDVTSVTTNSGLLDSTVSAAVSACATAPCPVQVFANHATRSFVAQNVTSSGTLNVNDVLGSWATIQTDTGLWLVNARDGSSSALPSDTTNFAFSTDASRVAFTRNGGKDLYEAALPLPADASTLTPVVQSNGSVSGMWTSNNRYVGFDESPTTGNPYRFELVSGALTVDADYTGGTSRFTNSFGSVSWQSSAGGIRFTVGSGIVHDAPAGVTQFNGQLATEFALPETADGAELSFGTHAMASFDGTSAKLYDDTTAAPRTLYNFGLAIPGFQLPFAFGFGSGTLLLTDYNTLQTFPLVEPGMSFSLNLDESFGSKNFLLVGQHSVNGQPSGGAVALMPGVLL